MQETVRKKIEPSYYLHDDVIAHGWALLGKRLVTCIQGKLCSGIITETESYKGPEDRASHAYNFRRTARNEVMYAAGGSAYVYLCYGIHLLLNVVTGPLDLPHAVLIRGILPEWGVEIMSSRRGKPIKEGSVLVGPGVVTSAMGVTMKHNGCSLQSDTLWLEESGIIIPQDAIECLPRVGIDYAGEDALLPWRFRLNRTTLRT